MTLTLLDLIIWKDSRIKKIAIIMNDDDSSIQRLITELHDVANGCYINYCRVDSFDKLHVLDLKN